jgi:hypothetical protein
MYLRCTTIKSPFVKVKTKYFADGIEISRQQAEQLCVNDEFKSGTDAPVFTINLANIISIK